MARPVPEVVAILRDLLEAAERGQIADVFVIYREPGGEYGSAFWTHDFEDLLVQIGTEHLYLRGRQGRADDTRH